MNLSRGRRLTSIVSLHLPGENLSQREPHAHITVLARVHLPCGVGHVHADLMLEGKAQPVFQAEWRGFEKSWSRTLRHPASAVS